MVELATLRLFGPAREAAGTDRFECEATTVAGLLSEASRRFGVDFDRVLVRSRLWVNGEPAGRERTIDDTDEVAIVPPVSGG